MKPLYINPNCTNCGENLCLSDLLDNPDSTPTVMDSWACPKCYDGNSVYVDWSQKEMDEMSKRITQAKKHPEKLMPWSKLRKKLYKKLNLTEEEIKERENVTFNDNEKKEFQSKSKTIINIPS